MTSELFFKSGNTSLNTRRIIMKSWQVKIHWQRHLLRKNTDQAHDFAVVDSQVELGIGGTLQRTYHRFLSQDVKDAWLKDSKTLVMWPCDMIHPASLKFTCKIRINGRYLKTHIRPKTHTTEWQHSDVTRGADRRCRCSRQKRRWSRPVWSWVAAVCLLSRAAAACARRTSTSQTPTAAKRMVHYKIFILASPLSHM